MQPLGVLVLMLLLLLLLLLASSVQCSKVAQLVAHAGKGVPVSHGGQLAAGSSPAGRRLLVFVPRRGGKRLLEASVPGGDAAACAAAAV